jgi:hypothetical protein
MKVIFSLFLIGLALVHADHEPDANEIPDLPGGAETGAYYAVTPASAVLQGFSNMHGANEGDCGKELLQLKMTSLCEEHDANIDS